MGRGGRFRSSTPLADSTDYASLRPDRWAASRPEHIRTYRADEHHRRARRRAAKRNPS